MMPGMRWLAASLTVPLILFSGCTARGKPQPVVPRSRSTTVAQAPSTTAKPTSSTSSSTTSTTTSTVPGTAGRPGRPGAPTPQAPTLTLTRMGIFADEFNGFTGGENATLERFTQLLGDPDGTWAHPATPCVDYKGDPAGDGSATSARWGDLTVTFGPDGRMNGYVYGPPSAGYPTGVYGVKAALPAGITIGQPIAPLLAADRAAVLTTEEHAPHGFVWRVRGQSPGLQGFASTSDPATAVVQVMWVGLTSACFGLPGVVPSPV